MNKEDFYANYFNKSSEDTFFICNDEFNELICILYKSEHNEIKEYTNSLCYSYETLNCYLDDEVIENYLNNTSNIMVLNKLAFENYIRNILMIDVLDMNTHNYYEKSKNFYLIRKEMKSLGGKNVRIKCGNTIDQSKDFFAICATTSDEDYYYLLYDYTEHKLCAETCCSGIVLSPNQRKMLPQSLPNMINEYFEKYIEVPFTKINASNYSKLNRRVNKYQQYLK